MLYSTLRRNIKIIVLILLLLPTQHIFAEDQLLSDVQVNDTESTEDQKPSEQLKNADEDFCPYETKDGRVFYPEYAQSQNTQVEEQNLEKIENNEITTAETELIDDSMPLEDAFCPYETKDGWVYEPESSFFSFLDSSHAYLSSSVEAMARSMDQFFVDDKIFYESSGSYLRLRYSQIFEERGKTRSVNQVSFKLRLPNTEKRFKIFFESAKKNDPYNVTTQTEKSEKRAEEQGDYVLGLSAESGERFGWKYRPTIGADFDGSLDPFVKFKFSREDKAGLWTISWDETPFWYDSLGWGVDSNLVFNRKIDDNNLFRSSTFAGWKAQTEMFDLSQVFAIFHTINSKKAISFYSGVYGISEPKITTTEFLLGSIYRENLHKDYFFLEIEPQIRYQRINRFKPEHSIVFRFELLFEK